MNPIHTISIFGAVAIFAILHYLACPYPAVDVDLPEDDISVFGGAECIQFAQPFYCRAVKGVSVEQATEEQDKVAVVACRLKHIPEGDGAKWLGRLGLRPFLGGNVLRALFALMVLEVFAWGVMVTATAFMVTPAASWVEGLVVLVNIVGE
jgi:hypothetical protein